MLLKFFKRGGTDDNRRTLGGSAVKKYLLGTDDKPRENARLLLGNPEEDTEIINGLTFAKVYTSGCLSFHEAEQITEAQKYEMIDDFEKMIFVGLEPHQYTSYWVEHSDKGRLELNFVFPNVELTSGKSLQVYYHPRDNNLVNAWKNLTNDKYGLINPEDLENRRDVSPSLGPNILSDWANSDQQTLLKKFQCYQSVEDFKSDLTTLVLAEVEKKLQQGHPVANQNDVSGILTELGFEISRKGKDSISIKNPDPSKKNIKLKGVIYEQAVTADRIEYINKRKNDALNLAIHAFEVDYKAERRRKAHDMFNTELEKRRQRHWQRYGLADETFNPVLPKLNDNKAIDLDKQDLNLNLNTLTELVQLNLPPFKHYQWQMTSVRQPPRVISSDKRVKAFHDITDPQPHQSATAYRQLDQLIDEFGTKNRHEASAGSERPAGTNGPSPVAFNTNIVSTAVANYRRGSKKTKSAEVDSGRGLLNRVKNHQQRASQNAQTRKTRISTLTREDDTDAEAVGEFIATRRKRHRYIVEQIAAVDEPMSDILSNHDDRTARIKPLNQRIRNLKNGYGDNAREFKTTTDAYGKLATAISTLVEAVIVFFKGLYAGLKQKAYGYADQGFLMVIKQDDKTTRQATTAETKSSIDNHTYDLSGYMSLELTVENWDRQKKEKEKTNELKFRGFGF